MRKIQRYGWKPDLPDRRDYKFVRTIQSGKLPEQVDLRPKCPIVVDQGPLGSCVGNASAFAHQFEQMRQGKKVYNPSEGKVDPTLYCFAPSRLFIYYNGRALEGISPTDDSGMQVRDAVKSMASTGVCSSKSWPYHVQKFSDKPPAECYDMALKNQAVQYHRISSNLHDMLACLAQGNPFIFGFTVYESFEGPDIAQTGIMTMPGRHEQAIGGHCVAAVGYNAITKVVIVRNSWSDEWGQAGHFLMPFDYITDSDLADDRWVITSVE